MAKVIRYFAPTGAGAADGTSWANRAPFLNSGVVSTIITGFDFSGSDSLECRLQGGNTYALTSNWTVATWTNPPNTSRGFALHGCDSSGNLLEPPNPNWISPMPAWDDSALPVIATTTNISITMTSAVASFRLIKFTGSGANGQLLVSTTPFVDWCSFVNSTSNASAAGFSCGVATNCLVSMTGSSFSSALTCGNSGNVINCRLSAPLTASSGNRAGLRFTGTTTSTFWTRNTVTGFLDGFQNASGNSAIQVYLFGNHFINCGQHGYSGNATASQTTPCRFWQNYVANCGGYGFTRNSNTLSPIVYGNRFRDCSSGNSDFDTQTIELANYTTDSDDATEFVNAAAGDYRIKYSSAIWGKGYGAGDEAPSGSTEKYGRRISGGI